MESKWSSLVSYGMSLEALQDFPHSPGFSGRAYHRSSKASRREDLQVEEPVACWDCSSFHFYPTLPRMLGATLIGHQVVEMGQPREKRRLAATWMMVTVDGQIALSTSASKPRMRVSTHEAPQ
jgi:hypothetical protein